MLFAKAAKGSQIQLKVVRFAILVLPIVMVVAFPAAAQQHDHSSGSAASTICTAPGFGKIHHPVKTVSPQAQRLFEQAMALDYGFNHNQAEQCFRRAAELDPKMAMAYWGIALVLGTNHNLPGDAEREKRAYQSRQKGLAPSAGGSENELS